MDLVTGDFYVGLGPVSTLVCGKSEWCWACELVWESLSRQMNGTPMKKAFEDTSFTGFTVAAVEQASIETPPVCSSGRYENWTTFVLSAEIRDFLQMDYATKGQFSWLGIAVRAKQGSLLAFGWKPKQLWVCGSCVLGSSAAGERIVQRAPSGAGAFSTISLSAQWFG